MNTRADDLFTQALEFEGAAREAFLAGACGDDAELRLEVQRLLVDSERAETFFGGEDSLMAEVNARLAAHAAAGDLDATVPPEAEAVLDSLRPEEEGEWIGPYKLLQEIGEGGFGTVWMAEQHEPIARKVALKIVKPGMDTKQVLARFEAERQALSMMDHPNIARVLDAGATGTGRPYFVMELVRGIRITDYCDREAADTRQRLELFIQVCQAIQHAHQKGIIHRDIKPSNVMITLHDGVPVPKVIDFGIAKATQGKLTDMTLFTRYEQFIGTPAYMSPEQAETSGLDIDTRTDIYSLGALLYELLTGRPPFDGEALMSKGVDAMRKTLRESEPQRPSVKLHTLQGDDQTATARHHGAEMPKLIHLIRGDLDWIAMKCLEKDRKRRYETANGLAMDIRRYLDDEPVVARPPSKLYALRKSIRRHKVGYAAVVGVVLALVAGTILGFQTARRQSELSKELMVKIHALEAKDALDERDFDQAAKLLDQIPPGVDAMSDFRASLRRILGVYYAVNHRWDEAVVHLSKVLDLAPHGSGEMDVQDGFDRIRCLPVLLRSNQVAAYERRRREAIAEYSGSENPIIPERIIRICLLKPASEDLLEALDPLEKKLRRTDESPDGGGEVLSLFHSWRLNALAMLEYRKGHYENCEDYCRETLDTSKTWQTGDEIRVALTLSLRAMNRHRLHREEEARADLDRARSIIQDAQSRPMSDFSPMRDYLPGGYDLDRDSLWFDWLIASLLFEEAEAVMAEDS